MKLHMKQQLRRETKKSSKEQSTLGIAFQKTKKQQKLNRRFLFVRPKVLDILVSTQRKPPVLGRRPRISTNKSSQMAICLNLKLVHSQQKSKSSVPVTTLAACEFGLAHETEEFDPLGVDPWSKNITSHRRSMDIDIQNVLILVLI